MRNTMKNDINEIFQQIDNLDIVSQSESIITFIMAESGNVYEVQFISKTKEVFSIKLVTELSF
jgi:hypothetical protein